MEQSKFLSLGLRDFVRGLAMAALTPVFTTVYTAISTGDFKFDLPLIITSAIGGASAYLTKNLFTKKDSK